MVDFRRWRTQSAPVPISIQGIKLELVPSPESSQCSEMMIWTGGHAWAWSALLLQVIEVLSHLPALFLPNHLPVRAGQNSVLRRGVLGRGSMYGR